MTKSQRLERGYRRIVALYPRAFRRESEEEIVAVRLTYAGAAADLAVLIVLVVTGASRGRPARAMAARRGGA